MGDSREKAPSRYFHAHLNLIEFVASVLNFFSQWRNGQIYSGNWRSNLQDGVGTEIFPRYNNFRTDADGEIMFPYYEGRLKKGKRSGKGVYIFASGAKYKGEFSEGLFDGSGILSFTDGTYIDCKWRSGLPLSSTLQYSYRRKQKMAKKIKQSIAKNK